MAERGVEDLYRAARITSRSAETPLAAGAHRQLASEVCIGLALQEYHLTSWLCSEALYL